jgi:hypothetical protein
MLAVGLRELTGGRGCHLGGALMICDHERLASPLWQTKTFAVLFLFKIHFSPQKNFTRVLRSSSSHELL